MTVLKKNELLATVQNTPNENYTLNISMLTLLGIIISKLIGFYWLNKFADKRKTFPKIKGTYLKLIPLPNFTDINQIEIIKCVNQILATKKVNLKSDIIEQEQQIDNLVYRLYDLSWDEVRVIDPDFGLTEEEYKKIEI